MTSGLLVLSNVSKIPFLLAASRSRVTNKLYIQLSLKNRPKPVCYSEIITKIYSVSGKYCDNLDVRVLVSNLRGDTLPGTVPCPPVDIILCENETKNDLENVSTKLGSPEIVQLLETPETSKEEFSAEFVNDEMVDSVVLGGTFDRLHVGHKILLSSAVVRANKRLVVGVTDFNMIKSKKLHELILPIEVRINELREFLMDIDPSINYDIVPISDPFGPTKTDPDLDLIVVSRETLKGGAMVNETRKQNGLRELKVVCIDLVELETVKQEQETKVSSSNQRMEMLGTKLKCPEHKPHLPNFPYVIGLVGGIASGKSVMCERFRGFGAKVIDCDKLAHSLYEPGAVCYDPIIEHFGKRVVGPSRKIDRRVLGQIVFSNPKELETLNGIVWPALAEEIDKVVKNSYEKEGCRVVVIEAAVLLKAGLDKNCHEIWCLIIPPEEALRRIMERDKLSEEAARQRINNQVDNSSLVAKSNVVFSSLWSHEYTQKQAEKAWKTLTDHLESKHSFTNSKY